MSVLGVNRDRPHQVVIAELSSEPGKITHISQLISTPGPLEPGMFLMMSNAADDPTGSSPNARYRLVDIEKIVERIGLLERIAEQLVQLDCPLCGAAPLAYTDEGWECQATAAEGMYRGSKKQCPFRAEHDYFLEETDAGVSE